MNKGGKKCFVSFSIYPFFDETGNILGTSTIVRDKTDAVMAERALIENEKRMRKLALHIDAVREEERKQIAFAIHDELGYALSAIKMDIIWMQKKFDSPVDNISVRFQETLKLIDTAIQKVKNYFTKSKTIDIGSFWIRRCYRMAIQRISAKDGNTLPSFYNSARHKCS